MIPEKLNYEKISNFKFAGIDYSDYPDFADVYVESADYDGEEMTENQLDNLNNDRDFVYDKFMESIF